jgi:small subunit ribosomal protein S20
VRVTIALAKLRRNFTEEARLPNIESAKKRMRQNEKRRLRNRKHRSAARTFVKRARLTIEQGDLEAAREATLQAISALDHAASKGVIHSNNAARRKSRLMQQLARLEAESG